MRYAWFPAAAVARLAGTALGATVLAATLLATIEGCSSSTTPGPASSSGPAAPASSAPAGGAALGNPSSATASSSPPGASAPPATSAPPAAAGFTVCITPVVTCSGEMRTEPVQIIVSGDGTAFVSGLTWAGWGSATATGTGTLKLDNCNPNCAQGSLTGYPATVTLSDPTAYGSSHQGYAAMSVSAPSSSFGTRTYSGLIP